MQILNSLLPIFIVIGLGILLRWRRFLTAEITQGMNRFAYFVALPAFLFYRLAEAPVASQANWMIVTLLVATLVTLAVSWLVSFWVVSNSERRGAMIHASFRGNLAFIGLPLILYAISDQPDEIRNSVETAVLLTMAPVVIVYNVAAVVVLSVYNQRTEQRFSWPNVVKNVLLNPILLGCLTGMVAQKVGWQLPTFLHRTCAELGSAAFPLALLGIGSQLASISVSGQWSGALTASALKCILCPALGYLVGTAVGLEGAELLAAVVLCAVPTAVSSYVLTDQMNGDSELAASSVVIATSVSMVTLSVVLMLL